MMKWKRRKDQYDKIDWIEKRIKEIWRAYGNRLPAIAIFLNNKDVITSFVRELQDRDFFQNNGIDVVDGSQGNVLGSSMQVRVYPINVVKGMEFDAVFFHNIDQTNIDDDMLKKYIYVGISRAAFFLGVTLNIENDDIIKYFDSNIDWSII